MDDAEGEIAQARQPHEQAEQAREIARTGEQDAERAAMQAEQHECEDIAFIVQAEEGEGECAGSARLELAGNGSIAKQDQRRCLGEEGGNQDSTHHQANRQGQKCQAAVDRGQEAVEGHSQYDIKHQDQEVGQKAQAEQAVPALDQLGGGAGILPVDQITANNHLGKNAAKDDRDIGKPRKAGESDGMAGGCGCAGHACSDADLVVAPMLAARAARILPISESAHLSDEMRPADPLDAQRLGQPVDRPHIVGAGPFAGGDDDFALGDQAEADEAIRSAGLIGFEIRHPVTDDDRLRCARRNAVQNLGLAAIAGQGTVNIEADHGIVLPDEAVGMDIAALETQILQHRFDQIDKSARNRMQGIAAGAQLAQQR